MTHSHQPTQREILAGIEAKQARRPRVDHNGHPLEELTHWQYDDHGRLIGPAPARSDA
jgi:hypothetical protein